LKKEAKTFAHLGCAVGQRERLKIKSFWFFFSKKNCFLSSPSRTLGGDQE
jgi:hypothetical protein